MGRLPTPAEDAAVNRKLQEWQRDNGRSPGSDDDWDEIHAAAERELTESRGTRNAQAEKAVLGAVLIRSERLDLPSVSKLRRVDFVDLAHARLWDAIAEQHAAGKPLNLSVLADKLGAQPGEPLGFPFLQKLVNEAGTGYAADYFADQLLEATERRECQGFAKAIDRLVTDGADLSVIQQAVDAFGKRKNTAGTIGSFGTMNAKSENQDLLPPVIDGIVRRGETWNVVSDSKAGKSWFVHNLALSVRTGEDWLGFPVTQGGVLILDNELHEPTFCYRIRQIAAARRLDEADFADRLDVECFRGRLVDINEVVARLKRIPKGKYNLVILDSLYRFAPKGFDENSNAQTTEMYNLIDTAAAHLGAAIVCVRHTSKGNQSSKSVTDVGAGAGAQSRTVDCHLALRAHEEDGAFVMAAAVRSFPKLDPVCIRFDWPVFYRDDSLDPTLLAPDKPKKAKPAATGPLEHDWTPARLAQEILTRDPQPQAAIIVAAQAAGLSERRAKKLLDLAASCSPALAFQWLTSDRRQKHYANVPQTTLSVVSEVAE